MKKILPTFCFFIFYFFALSPVRANDLLVENPYTAQFNKAYSLYPSVPKGILEAVAYTQSRFYHLDDNMSQSCAGIPKAYGVMGLIANGKNYFRNNLSKVAALSGFSERNIIKDPETNIIAYAAAFSVLQQQYNLFSSNAADYSAILIELSELPLDSDVPNDFVLNSHLYQLYWFLASSEFQDAYHFPDHHIDLKKIFGANYNVLSAGSVKMSDRSVHSADGQSYRINSTNSVLSPDYPPAIWDPTSCNYSSRGSTAISAIAIHDVEGTYAGCISWFKNCSASVSAHYVVRSSDGQITQMVYEADKAWHIGSENPYTLGIEHEGYNNNPSWYTNAMYGTSANLVKDMCSDNGINPLRCYYGPGCSGSTAQCLLGSCTKIKGHQMYPNQTHDDPGPYWNWEKYYKLINNTYTVTTYTASAGNFYDSGGPTGNYGNDERRVWLFTRPAATNITLNFTAFNVENNYDNLFLYDGGNINSPLIGKYTGTVSPGPVTSTNDSLLVEFRSDCATTATGWAASYTTNVSSASGPDLISPTTSVTASGSWQTTAFTATISDADNSGGSGVEKGYYQVIDYNGTEWRANYTHGFFADNFDNAIHPEWTQKVGTWTIGGNALVQTDETSTAANNTNIYAALTQTLSNRYLYHFLGKFEGAGNSRRAGLHFFCDNPDSSNRNNSYFVWFRLDDQKIQIYKVVNNNFGIPKIDQALAFNAAQWYDIKIIYDRITGKISVYMNDALVATWTDPSPYSSGGYISFRSGNCKFSIDEIKVYRSRASTVNVSLGSGNAYDIRYQNPNPLTASAKIKSICQDSAQNLSPIYYYDLNVDWTPPAAITAVNDGKGSDIALNCNKDSLSANWTASNDTNSAVVRYWYSVGTSPGATNVLNWTSNWGSTSVTSNTLSMTQNTVYYFNVKAEDGAGLFSGVVSSNGQKVDTTCAPLGIEQFSKNPGLSVHPNPFADQLNVSISLPQDDLVRISLTDMLGRELVIWESKEKKGETLKQINVGGFDLKAGTYILKVQAGEKIYFDKLIRQ